MERIAECCRSRILLYRHSCEAGIPEPEISYRYMIAVDVYDQLRTALPGAVERSPSLSAASRMSAGELYYYIYVAATIRQPRKRDCETLDRLQAQLMQQ